jgi:ABC-type branched-subunit amino acid transport system substrate-binding protein
MGAQAYFDQVNASGVLKGITIKYLGFTADGGSPASALAATRQLVAQDHVFAIVPDMSQYNDATYMASQHVPYVGLATDNSYCSTKSTTSLWGFGWNGCLIPKNPSHVADSLSPLFSYAKAKTGSAHPSFLTFSTDTESGVLDAKYTAIAAKGAGFKVVYAQGDLPNTVSDYTPYVEQWMTAAGGKPPQVIYCLAAAQCLGALPALKAVGFTGVFYEPLGNGPTIGKLMEGATTSIFYNSRPNPGLTQMQDAFNALTPGTQLSFANVFGYFGASMFVDALKKVGNDDTPSAVQKALATQTWQIKGLVGPTKYPASTVTPTPYCQELLSDNADGSFTTLAPYSCSYKSFKV